MRIDHVTKPAVNLHVSWLYDGKAVQRFHDESPSHAGGLLSIPVLRYN